jgi:microcystin-dependent protein
MDAFIGTIMAWAPTYAPQSWAFCQGQTLAVSQNQALFALIGTTYGGNGSTNFQLPNLSGRVPIGAGTAPGQSNITLGQIGGAQSVILSINQMPTHTHVPTLSSVSIKASATEATDLLPSATANVLAGPYDTNALNALAGFTSAAPDTVLNTGFSANISNSTVGGSQPVPTLPPFLGLNYIICLQGIFPPRN